MGATRRRLGAPSHTAARVRWRTDARGGKGLFTGMLEIGSVLGALALIGIGAGVACFVAYFDIDEDAQREPARPDFRDTARSSPVRSP